MNFQLHQRLIGFLVDKSDLTPDPDSFLNNGLDSFLTQDLAGLVGASVKRVLEDVEQTALAEAQPHEFLRDHIGHLDMSILIGRQDHSNQVERILWIGI